jgi:hypothetical protein
MLTIAALRLSKVQMLGLLLTLASGCYSSGSLRKESSGPGAIRQDNPTQSAGSDFTRSTERDHGAGWESERDSEGNSY